MDKTTISDAAREVLDASPDLGTASQTLTGRLNDAGMIVKQLSIVRFGDGSHVVFVSDNGANISVEISP